MVLRLLIVLPVILLGAGFTSTFPGTADSFAVTPRITRATTGFGSSSSSKVGRTKNPASKRKRSIEKGKRTADDADNGEELLENDRLVSAFQTLNFSRSVQSEILEALKECRLFENNSSEMLFTLSHGLSDEVLATMLHQDFNLSPLVTHQVRSAIQSFSLLPSFSAPLVANNTTTVNVKLRKKEYPHVNKFSDLIVDEGSKKRRHNVSDHNYGIPSDESERSRLYPTLSAELASFYEFMTLPSTASQDAPIRPTTAKSYLNHARLFLGWYVRDRDLDGTDCEQLSLPAIIPSSSKDSAKSVIDFVVWLRSRRKISASYEANLLRGLGKLLKFRFAEESKVEANSGVSTYSDIAALQELRKILRVASSRERLAPRCSNESRKWISWPEYLSVVDEARSRAVRLIGAIPDPDPSRPVTISKEHRRAAYALEIFLLLSFFAYVPDRQRTMRELQLEKSFVFDEDASAWGIKHSPDDYKTGKTYGDRPLLRLPTSLKPLIDDYLNIWRPCLKPKTKHVFVQPQTGNPLTSDSVYKIVVKACFDATGKRTNPHLLRDMIVTHIRESDASERDLESLALFMGHSIAIQRASYDRRTLGNKVAPAVSLLQSVNNRTSSSI